MRARLAALAAVAALTAVALPGHAAPAPQITDPANDAVIPEASLDIVSALFATSGTTSKVNGKSVYKPTKLEITVTYAAAPNESEIASQAVQFDLGGCGALLLQRFYGGTWATADCLPDPFDFTVAVKDKTVQFSLPFGVIGSSLKAGSVLSNLRTWTGAADPVIGFGPTDVTEAVVADSASTTATYKVA